MKTHYTIHLVSQRLLFRKTFVKLIALLDDEVACQEYASDFDTLTTVPAPVDGAVLLDCASKSADELIEAMLHLLSMQAEASIILVLDEQEDTVVDAGMSLGAMGVIIKASPPQIIIDSLHRILAGERCRPAPAVALTREDIPEAMRRQLTARQQKMLRAIMGGQSISATAKELNLTSSKLIGEMRQVMAMIRGRSF